MAFGELETIIHRTLPDARIESIALPHCGIIRLGLINADYPEGPLDPEVMRAVIQSPAYWAFCWGSGLALARLLHAEPRWVKDRRIVDLGSGSGVCAIAAGHNGASRLIACDNDPDALAATAINARANSVQLTLLDDLEKLPPDNDLLIMADVLYDTRNMALIDRAKQFAKEILIADSRVKELPDPDFREIRQMEACTYPNLGEFDEFRKVRLFHWQRMPEQWC